MDTCNQYIELATASCLLNTDFFLARHYTKTTLPLNQE